MNLNRAYQWCALWLALLGVASFAVAAEQTSAGPPLVLVWALPALCTGWYLSAARSFVLPRAAVNALLIGAVAYAALQALSGLDVNRFAELVIFLLIIKVGDRRTPRDDGQIIALSVFLAIAAMLTGNSLLVGLILAAFLPLLVATVMLFQLQAGWLRVQRHTPSVAPAEPPKWASLAVPGLGRLLRRTVAAATFGTLLFSFLVFVILPRGVGENFMGTFGRVVAAGSRTGFTDRVSLGDRGLISESQEVVFTVELRQESGENLGTPDGVHYLRGAVLDSYDEKGTWYAGRRGHTPVPTGPRELAVPIDRSEGPIIEQIIRVPNAPRGEHPALPIFALWKPVSIEIPRRGHIRLFRDQQVHVMESTGDPGPLIYRVHSAVAPPPGARRDERTPASFDLPRIREIAAAILEPAGVSPDPATRPIDEDARAARLIQEHLRRNYGYTLLESQTPTGVDPIEHFLLTSREGHCEYFAAAMAALCRSVGINARIVAGYLAAEYNEASGHYIVRESNAHAWVEAEAGMGNWRMYDPTPPADLARLHRPAPGFFTRLRQMFDAAEHAWNRSVVGFDERAREQILAPASGPGQLLAGRLENLSERIRIGGGRLFFSALLRGLVVFAAAAALLFSLSMLAGLLPRRARSRAGARPRWPELRFYEHLLRALRRLGHPKPLWRPPLAHAATLSDEALATPAAAITRLYYRARFGGVMPTQTELAEARAALRRLKRRDRPVR